MSGVWVRETTHDLSDRVGLANVREELVTEALALRCTTHNARNIDERHDGRQHLLRLEDLREPIKARVRKRHDADVRLDRRERVIRGEHVRAGQRIKQGRLTDVGQSSNTNS